MKNRKREGAVRLDSALVLFGNGKVSLTDHMLLKSANLGMALPRVSLQGVHILLDTADLHIYGAVRKHQVTFICFKQICI